MAGTNSTGWSIRNIMKLPDIRQKLFNTLLVLIVVRLGAQIPVPGVSRDVFASWFESQSSGAADLFDMMTGGSFSQMSIFALSITPYITASIIMKLMTIRLLKRYDPRKFTFEVLNNEYGIFAVRGPRGIPQKLSDALK